MAQRFTREKMLATKNQSGGFNGPGLKYVDLKVDKNTPEKTVTFRLIGFPMGYCEHSNYLSRLIDDPKTGKKKREWYEAPFFDDEEYEKQELKKKWNRICTKSTLDGQPDPAFGPCPWCEKGYRSAQKFAQNVIVYNKVKDPTTGKFKFEKEVAILQKGKTLFVDGIIAKEQEHEQLNAQNDVEEGEDGALYTFLGGERSYLVTVTAKYNPQPGKQNNPDYVVAVNFQKVNEVSEEDIELLRAIGEPTAEELEAIYKTDPDLRDFPAWFNYGYKLSGIYKPTPVKEAKEQTAGADELDVSAEEGEDEETPAAPPAAKAKTSTKAAAKVDAPAADENPFSNVSDDDDSDEWNSAGSETGSDEDDGGELVF